MLLVSAAPSERHGSIQWKFGNLIVANDLHAAPMELGDFRQGSSYKHVAPLELFPAILIPSKTAKKQFFENNSHLHLTNPTAQRKYIVVTLCGRLEYN